MQVDEEHLMFLPAALLVWCRGNPIPDADGKPRILSTNKSQSNYVLERHRVGIKQVFDILCFHTRCDKIRLSNAREIVREKRQIVI